MQISGLDIPRDNGLKLFLEKEDMERLYDFEEECVEGYFRETDIAMQQSTDERIKATNERVENMAQKIEDINQKENLQSATVQVNTIVFLFISFLCCIVEYHTFCKYPLTFFFIADASFIHRHINPCMYEKWEKFMSFFFVLFSLFFSAVVSNLDYGFSLEENGRIHRTDFINTGCYSSLYVGAHNIAGQYARIGC